MSEGNYATEVTLPDIEDGLAEASAVEVSLFGISQFAPSCPSNVGLTAVGVNSTHVRVTFSEPVLNNAAITNPDVWTITPPGSGPITVLAVIPESDPVGSVLLTTTEHQTAPNYSIQLDYLEKA